MTIRIRTLATAAIFSSTLGLAAVATADTATDLQMSRSVKVSFAELDLTKPAGIGALYERLQDAAETVCGRRYRHSLAHLGGSRSDERAECYESALSRAVSELDLSALKAVHDGSL